MDCLHCFFFFFFNYFIFNLILIRDNYMKIFWGKWWDLNMENKVKNTGGMDGFNKVLAKYLL